MKIFLVGDIAFTGIVSEKPEKNNERYKKVIPLLNSADMVIANLEVPVKADETRNEYKNFIHYSLPGPTRNLLKLFNIGCVSLANNHIYDCKMPGLEATIRILDELGVKHTGAGWLAEHIDPVFIGKNGCKIAFLAYIDKSTGPKTEYFPQLRINYFDLEKVISDVRNVRHLADKVIVSIHWGVDYSFYPTPGQIEISKRIVNAGTDIVMGHHPHTLQPYEIHHDGFVFYSLGGLTFGDYAEEGKNDLQALFRKTKQGVIVKYFPGREEVDFISTEELKGNYIRISSRDYRKWSKRAWSFFKLKRTFPILNFLFTTKEKIIDRIHEYFFGYYKNPVLRLFQFSNIHKFKKLFRHLL